MELSHFLKKENNNLDLIRIILACFVIIGHAPILNGGSPTWLDPIAAFFPFTYSGALAVKLFFFISGLVVSNSLLNNKSVIYFIISRFFRLIPALLFVLLCSVFVVGLFVTNEPLHDYFSHLNHFQYIRDNISFYPNYILPGVFTGNIYGNVVNGSLWSLRYEVGCYIAMLGFFLLLANKNKYYLNIPIALIILDSFLPSSILFTWLGNNPEINLLPVSFAYGAFFAVNVEKLTIDFKIVLGSFLIYYIFNNVHFTQVIFILTSCNTLLYLASTKFVLKLKPRLDISYGIYLWGFLVQQIIYHILGHLYVGMHCIIALFFSIVLAIITHIIIEKPFIKIGRKCITYIQG